MVTKELQKKVDGILSVAKGLFDTRSVDYIISAVNPAISTQPNEFKRGSNKEFKQGERRSSPKTFFGEDAYMHFEQDLNDAVNESDFTKVIVYLKMNGSGKNNDKIFEIKTGGTDTSLDLRETQNAEPGQSALGNVNDILAQCFGGLGGTEGSGLGSILAVRDSLMRSEYEGKLRGINEQYEKREQERREQELRQERDEYKTKAQELEVALRSAERELEKKDDEMEDLEERIEELEKMKPEASVMGVALTGVAAKALESFALNHAGTIGKLMGVDKNAMLGMLMQDNQEAAETAMQSQAQAGPATATVSAEEEGPRYSQIQTIKMLAESLTDEEFEALYSVVLYLDGHREAILQLADGIKKNGGQ